MSDNYEFFKSQQPQEALNTPYLSKQWNFIGDINQGIYSNGSGLCLTQFDLSSIFNSSKCINTAESFICCPITIVSAVSQTSGTSTTLTAPTNNGWAYHGLKNGYFQIVHGADITLNGKTLEQFQPNLNMYVNFKLLSSMDQNDIKNLSSTLGMGDWGIEDWQSMVYNAGTNVTQTASTTFPNTTPTGGLGGNGISNNKPFTLSSVITSQTNSSSATTDSTSVTLSASNSAIAVGQLVSGAGVPPFTYVASISTTALVLTQKASIPSSATLYFSPQAINSNAGESSNSSAQNVGTYNKNYYSRLKKIFDSSSNVSNLVGSSTTNNLTNISNFAKEFKPYTYIANSYYITTFDIAIIRMCDLFDSMKQLPMAKKLDMNLRLYFNVGNVISNITENSGLMVTSANYNTFTNTCPIMQSCLNNYPANASSIATGLFIGSPTNTSLTLGGQVSGTGYSLSGVNLNQGQQHFLQQCRFYYPAIELKPEIMSKYLTSNRNKRYVFESILTNTFANIGSGTSFSYLVQSGCTRIKGVLILPFLAAAVNGSSSTSSSGVVPFSQYLSPFDSAPSTTCPFASLINLQVMIGGANVLQNIMSYGWEEFIEQINPISNGGLSDLGMQVGLYNSAYWDYSRMYFFDCSRCANSDKLTPRNINISGTNNINSSLDLVVFTIYEREGVFDVETGELSI
jgi:hypothetical protein